MRLISSPRLLLIAQPGSYRIAPFLAAARRMGLDAVVASRGEHSLISELVSGLHIDLEDLSGALDIIEHAAAEKPFVGILGSDDSTVELAAICAEKFELPHNPPDAAKLSRRKDLARACLAAAGCAVPWHRLIDLAKPWSEQADLAYPCVLKPLNMSASRGVIRVDDTAQFIAACERIAPIVAESVDNFEKHQLLVEQYIDGVEIAYEGYLHDGQLHTLTIFDKPDPLTGPFFAETIYTTPSVLPTDVQTKVTCRVQEACTAYGLTTGPIHAELRIDARDAWILEVAARTIGGDCSRTLDNGSGFSLEELAIALAIGEQPPESIMSDCKGVMMLPVLKAGILRRVEGLARSRRIPGIDSVDIVIPEGHELVPLPEGNQYLGYIFATGKNVDEVNQALRAAYAELEVKIAPLLHKQVIVQGTGTAN